MDLESHHTLLDKESGDSECYHHANNRQKANPSSQIFSWLLTAAIHVLISLSLIAILYHIPSITHNLDFTSQSCVNSASHANDLPFDNALTFSTVQPDADAWKDSLYTSEPSHNSNAAWKQLQEVRGVAITPEEAARLNIPDTGLTAGNGTTATLLGIQHNLHCIRFVRQVLHPGYYYPDETAEEHKGKVMHAGHCLEALRQSMMCTPDLTPRSVIWEDEERTNIAVNPSVRMECLNWESLVGWMRGRGYSLSDLWEENPAVEE